MILEIERAWNREPGWFVDLDGDRQARLLAWWNVLQNPKPEAGGNTAPGLFPQQPRQAPALGGED